MIIMLHDVSIHVIEIPFVSSLSIIYKTTSSCSKKYDMILLKYQNVFLLFFSPLSEISVSLLIPCCLRIPL